MTASAGAFGNIFINLYVAVLDWSTLDWHGPNLILYHLIRVVDINVLYIIT
jgi:hypothetical protein